MKGLEVVEIDPRVNLEKVSTLKPGLIIGNKLREEVV